MPSRKLLMISTDRLVFQKGSTVRVRQVEYAKDWNEVHIIVFAGRGGRNEGGGRSGVIGEEISENCRAYSAGSVFKFLYPFDAIRIGRKIIQGKGITDITCQDPSLTAMAGVSLKKTFGLPLEIQVHGDIGSRYFAHDLTGWIRKKMAHRYLPFADRIRVVSKRIKDYLVDSELKIPEEKIEIKPISVDIDYIRNSPVIVSLRDKYPQYSKIVFMASRLEREKNIDLAIRAWPEVLKRNPGAGLVIVGKGSCEAKLKGLVHKMGVSKNVVFEPWADKSTLASYYKTANVFLNTSLFEGYGMTLIEAKAAGCKVISTDVGVARETGAVVVENNPTSVLEALDKSLS